MSKHLGRFEDKSYLELQDAHDRAMEAGQGQIYQQFRAQFKLAHPEFFNEKGYAIENVPNKYTVAAGFIVPRINAYLANLQRQQRINDACEEYEQALQAQDIISNG